MTTETFYAKHAWQFDRVNSDVVIEVTDGVITHTGYAEYVPDGATQLSGVTVAGLVNAHSHVFHRLLRGGVEHPTGGDDFWRWRDAMFHLSFRLDPDRYYQLARAVFAEMASAGITTVGEFHYVHHDHEGRPYGDPNEMGKAAISAAESVGIRITLIDAAYLRSGFGDDPLNRYSAALRRPRCRSLGREGGGTGRRHEGTTVGQGRGCRSQRAGPSARRDRGRRRPRRRARTSASLSPVRTARRERRVRRSLWPHAHSGHG